MENHHYKRIKVAEGKCYNCGCADAGGYYCGVCREKVNARRRLSEASREKKNAGLRRKRAQMRADRAKTTCGALATSEIIPA
jgi:methionyl-tRNA synthetase